MVIQYWVLRTKFLRKLRTEVYPFIKNQLETECQFCGNQYGLQVELLESLEDVFYQYLEESGETVRNFRWHRWFVYFQSHSSYRTLCSDCHDELEANYVMQRKKLRRAEKIADRLEKERDEFANMTEADKAKWLAHIKQGSERSREVIQYWIASTRLKLLNQRRAEILEEEASRPY